MATADETLALVEQRRLYDTGRGIIDVRLPAAKMLTLGERPWTHDRKLHGLALRVGVAFEPTLLCATLGALGQRPPGGRLPGVDRRGSAVHRRARGSRRHRDAGKHLSQLVDKAAVGEDVVVSRHGKPIVRITQLVQAVYQARFGALAGRARIVDDFDEPLPPDVMAGFEERQRACCRAPALLMRGADGFRPSGGIRRQIVAASRFSRSRCGCWRSRDGVPPA